MPIDPTIAIGFPALVALALTWAAVWGLRFLAPGWGLMDVPNDRSSHRVPTPRAGGLGFVAAVLLLAITASSWSRILPVPGEAPLLVGGTLVAAAGLADDRWGLSVRVRLGLHLLAAGILVVGGGVLHELEWPGGPSLALGWVAVPFTLLWIVGMTNAYNFMDGVDGIAAVQAMVAAGAAGVLALGRGDLGLALFAAVLVGGVTGFLLHNWPPARIFMGDVGSSFLGYTFGGLAVLSGNGAVASVPFALWLVLLSPFLFDTSVTLFLRMTRGERWYEAHRQHLYQRLVRQGWSHLRVTLLYLCADLAVVAVVGANVLLGLAGVPFALAAAGPLVGILLLVKWGDAGPVRHLGRASRR